MLFFRYLLWGIYVSVEIALTETQRRLLTVSLSLK